MGRIMRGASVVVHSKKSTVQQPRCSCPMSAGAPVSTSVRETLALIRAGTGTETLVSACVQEDLTQLVLHPMCLTIPPPVPVWSYKTLPSWSWRWCCWCSACAWWGASSHSCSATGARQGCSSLAELCTQLVKRWRTFLPRLSEENEKTQMIRLGGNSIEQGLLKDQR